MLLPLLIIGLTTGDAIVPPAAILGAHVVHVASGTPTVLRRSSGAPTVRDVEGQ